MYECKLQRFPAVGELMQEKSLSHINLANLQFIEEQYQRYLQDRNQVDGSWRHFFDGMHFASHMPAATSTPANTSENSIQSLIEAYRRFGHFKARSNIFKNPINPPELCLDQYGFHSNDLEKEFPCEKILTQEKAKLKDLLARLEAIYCKSIGYEITNLSSSEIEKFLIEKIEHGNPLELNLEEKKALLQDLMRAEMMEQFIHRNYPGQKRFSLEGGESLIPMLTELNRLHEKHHIDTVILGMAHRGRLNTLAHLMRKPYSKLFHEFEPTYRPPFQNVSGDVKYHLGYEYKETKQDGSEFLIKMMPNPSHLESVNAPTLGYAYGLQQKIENPKKVLPLIIHGDSAVAGQGIVYECMQLSQIEGYQSEGTLHIIINNQLGFTAVEKEVKTTHYSSDIAKAFGCPVFHVDGQDPEACLATMRLALDVRQRFAVDVFIELNCSRKYGHNESDEPRFTSPLLYQTFTSTKSPYIEYKEKLIANQELSDEQVKELENDFKNLLESELEQAKKMANDETPIEPKMEEAHPTDTSIAKEELVNIGEQFCCLPEKLHAHPKIKKLFEERIAALRGESMIDWGFAEQLALATLLKEGKFVRISGQDSRRGTFSHRHASIVDQETEESYFPLKNLCSNQKQFEIYNSPLSEEAVLGFEWGINLEDPSRTTIWEAQYGDFANGAQVMIDQYICSAEQKWNCESSLTLFLPHGYEGSGPEHSSARIERFLQLSAKENMRIVVPSTSAQHFHLIRHQSFTSVYKPLIVFTPKALLRFQPSLYKIEDFANASFEKVIDDPKEHSEVEKILFCTGKVYYDLMMHQEKHPGVAIIRIEQLYPFPKEDISKLLEKYKKAKRFAWVQEEHQNMGAYGYISPLLSALLSDKFKLEYAGREESASPAAGSMALHNQELENLFKEAFS